MKPRNFITFESDCPDDGVYSPVGDILVPGGLAVTKLVQQSLSKLGMQVTDPMQHSFYGWAIVAADKKNSFKVLLQCPGPWLLICEDNASWFRLFFRGKTDFAAFVEHLATMLAEVSAFSSISRFTQEEFEAAQRMKPTASRKESAVDA